MSTTAPAACKGAPKTLDPNGVSWEDRCKACFTTDSDNTKTCVKDLKTEYETHIEKQKNKK